MASLVILMAACGGGGSGEPADASASNDTATEPATEPAPAPAADPAPAPVPETAPAPVAEAPVTEVPAAAASTATARPYYGAPIALPATINAVAFDLGGQGVGYLDRGTGNAGGLFRPNEGVDIVASADSVGGGYTVNNFETGEWLRYAVQVPTNGSYDIALRVSSGMTGAFHVEVDGRDVTGRVAVPNTGGWGSFQWIGKQGITLTAGTHVLKIVSDQQYFNLNALRVVAAPTSGAKTLFKSGFEGSTALATPSLYGNGAWQDIAGTDAETGHVWPPKVWGGTSRFQLIAGDAAAVTSATLGNYVANQLQSVTGRSGSATRALYSSVKQSIGGALVNWDSTQNDFVLFPGATGQGDLYVSYWLKLQPDLLERMTVSTWAGRVVSDWKTGGDYRLLLNVYGDGVNKRLYWQMQGDNIANGGLPQQVYWQQTNTTVPVPVGRWFRVEMFVHRSGGADGRVWVAADGQKLFDRSGPNMGADGLPWNRIMAFLNYSSGQSLPAYQWVDDLEIWDGFPATASAH